MTGSSLPSGVLVVEERGEEDEEVSGDRGGFGGAVFGRSRSAYTIPWCATNNHVIHVYIWDQGVT